MKSFFRKIYDTWMKFANTLGRINTAIILTIVHLSIVNAYGIGLKLMRKDLLKLHDKGKNSYWIHSVGKSFEKDRYLRQF